MYGRGNTTKREQRLEEIGKMLLGGADMINRKGLEKFIASQKVSDIKVTKDYIRTMELRGWITQLTPHKYAIMKESLSEDLGRPIPENKQVVAEEVMAMMSRVRKV
jgi:hypothetical protein